MQERTHEIMERDGSLLWGNQHALNEELVSTFRIQWRFFFHCSKHHFEHIGLAHRVEYQKIFCTLDFNRLATVNFSRVGPYSVQLWIDMRRAYVWAQEGRTLGAVVLILNDTGSTLGLVMFRERLTFCVRGTLGGSVHEKGRVGEGSKGRRKDVRSNPSDLLG